MITYLQQFVALFLTCMPITGRPHSSRAALAPLTLLYIDTPNQSNNVTDLLHYSHVEQRVAAKGEGSWTM